MYKKIIISVIVITIIGGFTIKQNEKRENTIIEENPIIEKIEYNLEQEKMLNVINETDNNVIHTNEQKQEPVTKNDKEKSKIIEQPKKEVQKEQQNKGLRQSSDTEKESMSSKNQNEIQQTIENNKNNEIVIPEKIEEEIKEVTSYNDTESQKMKADIDTIAKQNKDLWDENGKALYQVKIHKKAMKGNYMYPYNIQQLKGKVLNVFACTFVIYAVDYEKKGYAKEVRYYITIE